MQSSGRADAAVNRPAARAPSRIANPKNLVRRIREDLWERPGRNAAPLDGMRGLASCLVVFYHCALFTGFLNPHSPPAKASPWIAWLANGFWSGIDIFFVLSGFLIGRLLIRDLEQSGRVFFGSFFLRRAFRIFPAYYLVLTLTVVWFVSLDDPAFRFLFLGAGTEELRDIAWANYLYVVNYVRPGDQPSPMSWAWSLCVEEHFYLLLPFVLLVAYWQPRRWVRLATLIIAVAAPGLGRLTQYLADPSLPLMKGFYYYSHNRFDEIFVGVLIAYVAVVHREWFEHSVRRAGHSTWVLGTAFVATVWIFGGLQRSNAFTIVAQFLLMALGSGLIVANCLVLQNHVTRFFAHPAWYPLARISYGTYLVHPFLLFAWLSWWVRTRPDEVLSGSGLMVAYLFVMVSSSLVAAVMFVAIESPLLRLGVRVSARYRP